jgi:hypothetical protein
LTRPAHLIPAGSPSDASTAQSSPCAVGAHIPAHAPCPDASAAPSPPRAAEALHSRAAALTPLQIRALDFIRDRITAAGSAPTLDTIAAHMGWAAKSSAHRIVESLVRKGMLVKTAWGHHGLALADGPQLSSVPTAALRAELARRAGAGE